MSEFKLNPKRQCKSLGHIWISPPYGQSSYYDEMKKKNLKICARCKIWSDKLDSKVEVH